MRAWEIWSYHPDGWPEPHPAVIVSHPNRVLNKPQVCILMCSSQQAGRPPKSDEVILDKADGLDWPTLCRCDLFYQVEKTSLKDKRGTVTANRREEIIKTIIRSNGWV